MEDHKSTTEVDKMDHEHDQVILPGFRFHPTDEELVGFYLKKKIQHRILPIELIKQVDIYKYDPWDLPNLAPSGEKEWYFYCPRDRKYKNSARPNRVTGAGFWKATGTDRPIYSSSSNDSKCIGLKKSLVFYRGRASKGIKTDWMMHEFRLPSVLLIEPKPDNKIQEKLHPNDAWAICRIFKKTSSMAQRVISHHAWASSINEDRIASEFLSSDSCKFNPVYSNINCMNDHHLCYTKPASINGFSGLETASYRSTTNPATCKTSNFPLPYVDFSSGFVFSSADHASEPRVLDMKDISKNWGNVGEEQGLDNVSVNHYYRDHEVGSVRRGGGVSFGLPVAVDDSDEWKLKMAWDEYSPPCPSESTTYSTNN